MDFNAIILILLIVIILILLGFVLFLNKRLDKFIVGTSSKNLEESMDSIKSSMKESKKFQEEMRDYLISVERRLRKSIQSIHTVRFNPFKGTGSGSNQSFSTAFLNEEKNGVVISSLYSREHISVYSKPIESGVSEYELSEEERESVEKAKGKIIS